MNTTYPRGEAWRELSKLREQLAGAQEQADSESSGLERAIRLQDTQLQESDTLMRVKELRSIRELRTAITERAANGLVERSLREASEDSGPLNPEKLVVQSLEVMRDISTRYLSNYLSYIDTIFWLDQVRDNTKSDG